MNNKWNGFWTCWIARMFCMRKTLNQYSRWWIQLSHCAYISSYTMPTLPKKQEVNSLQYAYITYSIWMQLCRCRYIMQMTEAMLYPIFTNWIFCVWWYLLYTRYHKLTTLHAASSYSYHIYTITRTFFMSWSH